MDSVVAVPLDEELASFVGKKGSVNGIAFYSRKTANGVITALFPSQDESKPYALPEALLVASKVLVSTRNIDKRFGEALVACSLLDKETLFTDDNDASALARDAGIADYRAVSKGDILEALEAGAQGGQDGGVRIDVDKAFPVKGIGTVVLGIVTRGTVRQHDKLFHTSGRQVSVRSIQSQDEDIEAAGTGTRVGLALKDIEDKEISKGDVIGDRQVAKRSSITISCRQSGIAKEQVAEGSVYGVAVGFSYSECVVKRADGRNLELELRSRFAAEKGDDALLVRKQAPRIFASGKIVECA